MRLRVKKNPYRRILLGSLAPEALGRSECWKVNLIP
jgi:hypothetical protein